VVLQLLLALASPSQNSFRMQICKHNVAANVRTAVGIGHATSLCQLAAVLLSPGSSFNIPKLVSSKRQFSLINIFMMLGLVCRPLSALQRPAAQQ
jgi:hypothetical protein